MTWLSLLVVLILLHTASSPELCTYDSSLHAYDSSLSELFLVYVNFRLSVLTPFVLVNSAFSLDVPAVWCAYSMRKHWIFLPLFLVPIISVLMYQSVFQKSQSSCCQNSSHLIFKNPVLKTFHSCNDFHINPSDHFLLAKDGLCNFCFFTRL